LTEKLAEQLHKNEETTKKRNADIKSLRHARKNQLAKKDEAYQNLQQQMTAQILDLTNQVIERDGNIQHLSDYIDRLKDTMAKAGLKVDAPKMEGGMKRGLEEEEEGSEAGEIVKKVKVEEQAQDARHTDFCSL